MTCVVSEKVLDTGEFVEMSVLDRAGATIFSFPGQVALDLFDVAMQSRRTVLLPQTYPMAVLNAAVGLPAHKAIGHSIFDETGPPGQALITAACARGDLTFFEFDRDVLPSPSAGHRITGRRIQLHYQDSTHFEMTIIGSAYGGSSSNR